MRFKPAFQLKTRHATDRLTTRNASINDPGAKNKTKTQQAATPAGFSILKGTLGYGSGPNYHAARYTTQLFLPPVLVSRLRG